MKEDINLLPPQAKSRRLKRLYSGRATRLYWTFALALLLLLIVYGGVYYALYLSVTDLNEQLANLANSDQEVIKNIDDTNILMAEIERITNANQPWSDQVEEVIRSAPVNVLLTAVRLRPSVSGAPDETTVLVISGTSRSRPSIVEYERKLSALPWVKQIEAPLTNLASGPDVTFTFTLMRKAK